MKNIAKVVSFVSIFIILFIICQKVLHYRWSVEGNIYTDNLVLKQSPADSYDVLFFGTSEIATGIFPVAMYQESGITGFNCATARKSSITTYYQLEYALRYQTPKVVCCDFSSLYDDQLPGDAEKLYRKIYDTIPDKDIKMELLKEVYHRQSFGECLTYIFPILRYHSMWNELSDINFTKDHEYSKDYRTYLAGSMISNGDYNDTTGFGDKIEPQLWKVEDSNETFSEVSVEYYDRFIKYCQDKGIKVVALIPPKISEASRMKSREKAEFNYFSSRGVDVINYNDYEKIVALGLTLPCDYADTSHLNSSGAIKVSRDLGHILSATYGMEDHRKDEYIAKVWNAYWSEYCDANN